MWRGRKFYGDVALEFRILCFVDNAHATLAQLF
jgi:hypothetical protein